MSRYDLVAIGGGTAGMTATVGVAGIGGRALLIERDRTGGDCLWTGCVPSKALIAAGSRAHAMRTADEVGIDPVDPGIDLARIMKHVHGAIATIEPADAPETLRARGVEVVHGHGRFVRPGVIAVGAREITYRAALIATGSEPALPAIPGLATADPLTSENLWELRRLPERLVVLGGGPVGCELGQAFARLGSRVTIVEMLDGLLPRETHAARVAVADAFRDEGIEVRTATTGVEVARSDGEAALVVVTGGVRDRIPFDRILVAAGRRPRTQGIGLERLGVEIDDDGWVRVDEHLATTAPHVYAAGDVTGLLPFTHVAGLHGGLVVTNALLRTRRRPVHERVPWVTFTDPEVARVGLTEEEARRRFGSDAAVRRFDYDDLDRAVTDAATGGFALVVAGPKGRIVGATIVARHAGEAIAEIVAWMRNDGTVSDLGRTSHAYPTLGEGPYRAALDHLRTRWLSPRVRRWLRPLLWVLRRVDRPR